jgi:hypothetical protein
LYVGNLPTGGVVALCTRYSCTLPGSLGRHRVRRRRAQGAGAIDQAINPAGAALPLSDGLILLEKLFAGLLEVFSETGAALTHEGEIPVVGDLLGLGEAFLFGAGFSLLTANAGRALPKPAVCAAIDPELTAYQFVRRHARMGVEVKLWTSAYQVFWFFDFVKSVSSDALSPFLPFWTQKRRQTFV